MQALEDKNQLTQELERICKALDETQQEKVWNRVILFSQTLNSYKIIVEQESG